MSARQAAIEGTKEVGLAVIAMTLSLIAVFLPVAFMAGIVGRFMNSFGVTMAFAIAVSLLVAFTLTPMLSSRWLREKDLAGGHQKSSRESRLLRSRREAVHGDPALVDAPPMGGGGGDGPVRRSDSAARHRGEQELHSQRRRVPVRDRGTRARGIEPREHAGHHGIDRHARSGARWRGGDGPHHRRRPAAHPQSRDRLREAGPGSGSRGDPVRRHGAGPLPDPAPVRLAQASRSSRTGVAVPRRPERGDHVLGRRPRPRPPRGVRLQVDGGPAIAARSGGPRHQPGGGEPRARRAHRSRQGRGPRGSGSRTSRRR